MPLARGCRTGPRASRRRASILRSAWERSRSASPIRSSAQVRESATASGSALATLAHLSGSRCALTASSGRPSGAYRCAASWKRLSGAATVITVRHRSTPGTTPGRVSRGTRPARTSDDLPEPLAPITNRTGRPPSRAPAARSSSLACSTARWRPKKTRLCLGS